ncbi:hypothetical protein LCGC14_0742520 [marine sediment metagenome]|uniref:Uncharacterized protein n=1 Tax=marine sediment metagenome TaxID=412755 RepID=A0A0F9SRD4_9ZZZZ
MIPNLGLFTEGYNIDEPIYQDGFINLYYGSGTEIDGERRYSNVISMTYDSVYSDNFDSWITNGVPDSWEDIFTITDKFLTTQSVDVTGDVLYHELFDLTNDILTQTEIEEILGSISEAKFAVQLNDSVYATQARAVGIPYEYYLSVQGFPIGDYVDGTYCKVQTSWNTPDFDNRPESNKVTSYTLEHAPNGSAYIVFYQDVSVIQNSNYAIGNKIMVDYWEEHIFIDGFDYNVIEDPLGDPFTSVLDWDYKINSLESYTMHPDFSTDSSFTLEFAALDWNTALASYINDGQESFTFRPTTLDNLTVFYSGETLGNFSIYGDIPEDQFNDTSIYQDIYVQILYDGDVSTIETHKLNEDPILYAYIYQDSVEYDHYLLDYDKIITDIRTRKNDLLDKWNIVPNSYVFVEVDYVTESLRYPIEHTPFNYDYLSAGNNAYHITLTIEGMSPIYSYDTVEFSKYISKIQNNYIYFNDKNYDEEGYIANQSQITLDYKFKLQPGLIDRKHMLMAIYPWSNVFDTILQSGDGSISYRERYRKLSGSSIISPFEYSLSISDTYSLFLSYRLNRREYFEEKFEIDYSTADYTFDYLPDGLDSYISEFDGSISSVYYYNKAGEATELNSLLYTATNHKITLIDKRVIQSGIYPNIQLRTVQNPITGNKISEFYVSFFAQPYDSSFKSHKFNFLTDDLNGSLNVNYWSIAGGDNLDVMPNFDTYYYNNLKESTYKNSINHATQISAYLEEGDTLSFDLAGELSWYDPQLLADIQAGNDYLTLYMNTAINNYEALEKILIELYDNSPTPALISSSYISIEEIVNSDFTLKIDLPATPGLDKLNFTPIFRTDAEYSTDNIPKFDSVEWDSTKTSYNSDGNKVMYHTLENSLFTGAPNHEIAYLFNNDLEYLSLPEGIDFNWSDETLTSGLDIHVLQIPELFIDPDNPSVVSTFEDGDTFTVKYDSPVVKTIQIGIEELFFQKKPFNYDTFSEIAEVLLINTDDTSDYGTFTNPYSYNISLPITPFQTEYLGNYRQLTVDINLSTLSQFAVNGVLDFSNIVLSVPNPAFELTIEEISIIQETTDKFPHDDVFSQNIWRNTEKEIIISGIDPSSDTEVYQLILENEPLFYNDVIQDKWLDYITIYDEDGNYYTAGLQGDDHQLIWDSGTGDFTWNEAFNQYPDNWGLEFELPLIIEPETKLYFEYSTGTSWSEIYNFNYENLDAGTIEVIHDYESLLKPRYRTVFGSEIENQEYDYELEQFYSESFTIYSSSSEYEHTFDIDYDLQADFADLLLYSIVGLYPNYTQFFIEDDDINYNIVFNPSSKTITITDLISGDGLLNQFDSITVILNFTSGPVSTLTQLSLSNNFNQTYITDQEATFNSIIHGSFNYFESFGIYLFTEDYSTITSDSTSFSSIDFTQNPHLGNSPILKGYNEYELYLNYEISENKFDTIYMADIEQDGQVEYKRETDIDKDGTIDITKYGIQDPENSQEILWYKIIQDMLTISKTVEKETEITESDSFEPWELSPLLDEKISKKYGNGKTITLHFEAKRSIEKLSKTLTTQYTRFYSIRFDYDFDGYGDAQIEYIKQESVAEYIIDITIETVLKEPNYPQELKQKYTQNTHLYSSTSVIREELIYHDLKEGETVETRLYSDGFVNDDALFNTEEKLNTLSITDDTGQQVQIDSEDMMFDTSSIAWDADDTWGVDNVPVKFDTVKIQTSEGDETVSNVYGAEIIINIPNRKSLYYDFLKSSPVEETYPNTKFIVEGILITPHGEKNVYRTSDKEKFFETPDHRTAKTKGSYLYYDSDLNGFYETVYILSPDDDGDGVYNVMSIGYNYDGSHDFVPYDTMLTNSEEYGSTTSQTTGIILSEGESYLDQYYKDSLDSMYPQDLSDGIAAKDYIFDISQLVIDSEASKIYPGLYNDVYSQIYAKSFSSYENQLFKDVVQEVEKGITAGIPALLVGMVSNWVAPFVFAGLYFLMSLGGYTSAKRARLMEEEKLKARTFYPDISDMENPPSLNEKDSIPSVSREGLVEIKNSHSGAYFTTAFGGEPGDMYTADVITSPPSIWRYAEIERAGSHSGWLYVDSSTGPQFVCKTYSLEDGGRQFTNFNLDYFLMTSELPALEDTLNKRYSPTKNVFKVELYMDSAKVYDPQSIPHEEELYMDSASRLDLYDAYKENTIGYLEQEVELQSKGQFDSIRPLVINGVPQYVFVDSHDELVSRTSPLSPLYSPIIVGQTRYDELISQGKYRNSIISVQADCAYGTENDVFNVYQLHPSEVMEGYSAKIPLSPTEFNYPIASITITVENPQGIVIKGNVDVDESDYTVVDGNLYFTRTLEEIVWESKAEWEGYAIKTVIRINEWGRLWYMTQKTDLDYNIKISFATVVPYIESFNTDPYEDSETMVPSLNMVDYNTFLAGMDYAGYHQGAAYDSDTDISTNIASYGRIGNAPTPQDIIDTTSNSQARMILAQTTSYTISDYFNQVQMAREDGPIDIDADEYTIIVTFWSTLITSLILLPATVMMLGSSAALTYAQAFKYSVVGIPFQVFTEIGEELYLDPLLESWVSGLVNSLGGDAEAANFWTLLVTSFREAFIGGVSQGIRAANKISSDVNLETILTLDKKIGEINTKKSWKSRIKNFPFKTTIGIIAAGASFFLGDAGIAILSTELNLLTEQIVDKYKDYYMKGIFETTNSREVRAQMIAPAPDVDTSAIDISSLFKSKKVELQITPSIMPASAMMASPAMTMDIVPRADRMRLEGIILREKLKVKALDDLLMGKIEGDFWTYKQNNEFDSYERQRIKEGLESLETELYEGQSILEGEGTSMAVKLEILQIVIAKKTTPGSVLTEFENRILNTAWLNLDGKTPLYSNVQEGQESPFLPLFSNFIDTIISDLVKFDVLEDGAKESLDNIVAYDADKTRNVRRITDVLNPSKEGSLGKGGGIRRIDIYTWQARIELAIESQGEVSDSEKARLIESTRIKFENLYRIFGYSMNRLRIEAILNLRKTIEVLYISGAITEISLTSFMVYIGRHVEAASWAVITGALTVTDTPNLVTLKNVRTDLINTLLKDTAIPLQEREGIMKEATKHIENSIWEVKQYEALKGELINIVKSKTDSLKKDLILDIIRSHKALSVISARRLTSLLFMGRSKDYITLSFLKNLESAPAGKLDGLLNILYSVSFWSFNDFDGSLNLEQLKYLKESVSNIVIDHIKKNLLILGDENFRKLYGNEFVYDQFEIIKAFWFALALSKDDGTLSFNNIDLMFRGSETPTGRLYSKLNKDNYKKKIGTETLTSMINIIEILTELEMQKLLNAEHGEHLAKIFTFDKVMKTILEYTGIYHLDKTRSQVQQSTMQDLLIEVRNYLRHSPPKDFISPVITTKGLAIANSLPNQGLYNHLELVDIFAGFPRYITSIDGRKQIEPTFNKKLTGFSEFEERIYKSTITTKLLKTVVSQYTRTSTQNPTLIQELFNAAEFVKDKISKGMDPNEAHKEIRKFMANTPYFVGSEIPIWISMVNTYTGLIDLLLFDPTTKTIYIVDYKPDLLYNNFGNLAFVNSIPQLAAYGLTVEQLANIQVECIMFNIDAAWVFDPTLVLKPIDAFMYAHQPFWISPWAEFTYYLSQ